MASPVAIPTLLYKKGDHVMARGHGWYGGVVLKIRAGAVRVQWEDGGKTWADPEFLEPDRFEYVAHGFVPPHQRETPEPQPKPVDIDEKTLAYMRSNDLMRSWEAQDDWRNR